MWTPSNATNKENMPFDVNQETITPRISHFALELNVKNLCGKQTTQLEELIVNPNGRMYGLLTKCEVKMAGYWPSFFCVFIDRDEVKVHKLAKKERGQYPAILTEQTWSIKDLLYGFWGNFACGIQQVLPSAQDGSILPARVANHSARFGSSCPLAELAT